MTENTPLLDVEDLTVQFMTESGILTAVSNATFSLSEGEYLGVVGESGCGKSTIARALLGALDENGRIESGTIRYKGEEIQDMSEQELNERIRWKEISFIPQASMNSLDPIQALDDKALEIANTHTDLSEEEALDRFREMFEIVGLPPNRIDDYPFQFSGGMQQRAVIALALFLRPSIVIADEPTTALDVIMQDQVLRYLEDIRDETDTSMVLITHDISLVFESCDEMMVMHSGQVAESGSTDELYASPRHPYLMLLQRAFPDIRNPKQELETIEGHPPQLGESVDFCTFADRCPWRVDECVKAAPDIEPMEANEDHKVACFRKEEAYQQYEEGTVPEVTSDDD